MRLHSIISNAIAPIMVTMTGLAMARPSRMACIVSLAVCCVFRWANRCFLCCLLIYIIFFGVFTPFSITNWVISTSKQRAKYPFPGPIPWLKYTATMDKVGQLMGCWVCSNPLFFEVFFFDLVGSSGLYFFMFLSFYEVIVALQHTADIPDYTGH